MRLGVRPGQILLLLGVLSTLAITGGPPRDASAQGARPTTVAQTALPLTVTGGEYALVQVILEFAPGAGVPRHQHGGPVVVTAVSILLPKGTEATTLLPQ